MGLRKISIANQSNAEETFVSSYSCVQDKNDDKFNIFKLITKYNYYDKNTIILIIIMILLFVVYMRK